VPLTQVIPAVDPVADRPSEFPDAFNDAMEKRASLDYRTITHADSPYSVAEEDQLLIADASGGAITINLRPVASSSGRVVRVKAISVAGGNVTIDGNASETIDGATTKVLSAQWASAAMHCNGSSWLLI
jgi:hypothetical protein